MDVLASATYVFPDPLNVQSNRSPRHSARSASRSTVSSVTSIFPRSRPMLERASPRTGEQLDQPSHEQRNFRTHAKQPATRSNASLPAPGTLSGLDAIPAG